jgi:hypothetical protein
MSDDQDFAWIFLYADYRLSQEQEEVENRTQVECFVTEVGSAESAHVP